MNSMPILQALGYAFENQSRYDVAVAMFDRLRQENIRSSTILAADILLKTIVATKVSAYGASKEIKAFPDESCDRAAALMDDPDPIVQSMSE